MKLLLRTEDKVKLFLGLLRAIDIGPGKFAKNTHIGPQFGPIEIIISAAHGPRKKNEDLKNVCVLRHFNKAVDPARKSKLINIGPKYVYFGLKSTYFLPILIHM